MYKEGQDTLPAPDNYWGAASGPSGAGPGKGDAVNPSIDFMPFATADTGEHLVLVETKLDHAAAGPGSRLTLTYVVANLNSFDHAAILGASIYSDPEHHMHSPAHDLAVTIQPGRHRLTRGFTIPDNASPGRYTVLWGIMKSDLSAYYALKKDADMLSVGVSPTASPPPAATPGWVPIRKAMPY